MLTNLHFSILDIALVMFMFLGIVIFFSWVPGRGMLLNVEQLLSVSKKKKKSSTGMLSSEGEGCTVVHLLSIY